MTIQDLIEAGIYLQGHLIVRTGVPGSDDALMDVFDGDGEDLGCAAHKSEPWYSEHEIEYMYPLDRGLCIEV